MKTREYLHERRDEILRISAAHRVRNVRIFGSVVREEDDETSDIDFLVELEPGCGFLEHAALVRELATLLGRGVDIVSERGLRPRIKDRIMREAMPL